MNYFLGIDIAKTNHVASLINNNGDVIIRAIKFINSNASDANVFNYVYDFIVQNNGTLEDFRNNIYKFAYMEILKYA